MRKHRIEGQLRDRRSIEGSTVSRKPPQENGCWERNRSRVRGLTRLEVAFGGENCDTRCYKKMVDNKKNIRDNFVTE